MTNEIKEILNGFKEILDNPTTTDEVCDGRIIEIDRSYDLDLDEIKILLDYITILQEENERLNNIINEFENKGYDIAQERADFLLEIDKLNNIIKIMEKYFELIVDLGFDYDGLKKEESLKKLIDELCKYASLGKIHNTTEAIFVNDNKKYNILNEQLKENK